MTDVSGIGIRPHLAQMVSGERYIQIHTHPKSTALSPGDLALFAEYSPIMVMAVAGRNGSWFVLSNGTPDRVQKPDHILALHEEAMEREDERLQARVASSEIIPTLPGSAMNSAA